MNDAGIYQCTAENGVGKPVSLDMKLDVLCEFSKECAPPQEFAINIISRVYLCIIYHSITHRIPARLSPISPPVSPNVTIEKSLVHSSENFDAQLVCNVLSEPQASVRINP